MNQESLLNIAEFSPLSVQPPIAWVGHLSFAAWLIREISPNIFVELGTHSGNSYFSFCQSTAEAGLPTKCYAVDTWKGDEHSGLYGGDVFATANAHNKEFYAAFSQLLRTTFDDAAQYFADGSIDLLHIDGLHTYEAVRHDFEKWLPKLAPGAVVLFHDTNVRERNFGVWKLWEELQDRYPHNLEFTHSHGLGVLQLNNAPDDRMLDWLRPGSPEKKRLRSYFSTLGSWHLTRFELNERKRHEFNLSEIIVERDGQVANLNHIITDRDGQIARLNQMLAARDEQIADLNQTIIAREGVIADLRKIVAERDARITEFAQASAAILNSTSWKLTYPIRFFGRQFLRFRTVLKAVPYARAITGGYGSLIRRMFYVYKDEGVSGIKRRIIFSATRHANIAEAEGERTLPDRTDYTRWVRLYDTLTEQCRERIKVRIQMLPARPLISVVMPIYNAKSDMLDQAIRSVRGQLYSNWELCIADDASTETSVRRFLQRYADSESRIKVVFREKNGGVSAASNSALELAKGEFIALLDNDDCLSEHALFWLAEAIVSNPDAGLIYSDEDKIDEAGRRHGPYFKPDWNPDLFLSHNVTCRLGAYRTDLVSKLGGFREGYEGAQDYDLALRCTEQLLPGQIIHIPRVLYHRRAPTDSTAQAGVEKNHAHTAGARALTDHFSRTRVRAKVELLDSGMYRARYQLPTPAPLVSLIIPSRNGVLPVKRCIESILRKTTYDNYEILIVDNSLDDLEILRYLESLASQSQVRILRDERASNYSALNNAAVRQAQGDYIALVEDDTEVISPEWLNEMVSLAIQPGVGAVGARLWYPNDTLQHGGYITGIGGAVGHSHKLLPRGHLGYFARAQLIQTLSAVTAACLVIKKEIYDEVGGLDDVNLPTAFYDVDFCLRVREAGYRNLWTPYAELYHYESATRSYENAPVTQSRVRNEVLYMRDRWDNVLKCDPAYNPNLTLDHEDFSYAWPPRTAPL